MSDDSLVSAMDKKRDESQKAMDLFRQMHKAMHAEETKTEDVPMVRLDSSAAPS